MLWLKNGGLGSAFSIWKCCSTVREISIMAIEVAQPCTEATIDGR